MKWLWDLLHNRSERKWARRVAGALTTEDLWDILNERVPPIVAEYFRGGADGGSTLRGNVKAFQQEMTTAWGARKFESLEFGTTVANEKLAVPWYPSALGSLRSLYPLGEAHVARAAGEFGTAMMLSTLTGTPMKVVRAATKGPCWYQLYLCGGREVATRGIECAKDAKFTGLVLTIDTGVAGNRAEHARMQPTAALGSFKGLSFLQRLELLRAKLRVAPQMLRHLSWLFSHWHDGGMMKFVNIRMDEQGTPMPYTDIGKQLASSAVTWEDLPWIKQAWGDGLLIIKGVHDAEDAKRAEACGAHAVIWSNHGGRQEDQVPPALHIVAEEMPKMKDSKMDFLMDGGARNGKAVLIALSYGVKAVGLGRVFAAGLGAGGYFGVRRACEIIQGELERSMRLVGVSSVKEIHELGAEIRRKSMLVGDSHLPKIVF